MKTLSTLLLAALMLTSFQTQASGVSCSMAADIAYQVMTVRQMNVITQEEYFNKIEDLKKEATAPIQIEVYDLAISIADMAYGYSVKSSRELKELEALSFKNTIWSMCL